MEKLLSNLILNSVKQPGKGGLLCFSKTGCTELKENVFKVLYLQDVTLSHAKVNQFNNAIWKPGIFWTLINEIQKDL